MNAITQDVAEQGDQDRLILDSVDRFLERHVRPVAMQLEHDDIYPQEIVDRMKDMGLFGAVISAEYGGARPERADLRPGHRADLDGLDVGRGHHQLPPDHGDDRQ